MKVTPECHHLLCAFNALGSQVRAPFALRLPFCRTGVDADIHVSWWYSKSFVKKKKKRWKTYQQTFRFWTPSTLSLKSPCVCTRRMPYSLNENNYKSEKGAHDTNLRLCLNDKCLFSHRYLPFAVVQTRLDKTPFDDDLTILFTPHDSKSRGKVFLGLARCQWLKQFICTKSE